MLSNEQKITLAEAAGYEEQFTGRRAHPSKFWRQCRRGLKARNGRRVYLEHVRIGGTIYTSAEALERFWCALADADAEYFSEAATAEAQPPATAGPSRSDSDRERAIAQAEAELDRQGI